MSETEIPDRFVKLDEVKRRVGLGKAMIYRLIQEGKFPAPYKLSPFASRWSDREIIGWIDDVKRSEEQTSELMSLMRTSYASSFWKKKHNKHTYIRIVKTKSITQ